MFVSIEAISKPPNQSITDLRPFHTSTQYHADAHQCASSSTAETMRLDRVHIVQLYKHSVAIELYRKVYPDAHHVTSNHIVTSVVCVWAGLAWKDVLSYCFKPSLSLETSKRIIHK